MRRPPCASAAAIRSTAFAICRRALFTATATLASSALMMRAISSADLRSRSTEAEFVFSVPRRRSSTVICLLLRFNSLRFKLASQGFKHRVVKHRAYLFDGLVLAVGPRAVGEQAYRKLAVRVDPHGRAGVPEVSEGTRREVFSRLRGRRGRVPSKRSGCAFRSGFSTRKKFDGRGAEDRVSAVEHGMGEDSQIFGGGEQAGMWGNAAEDARVFVLHLALDDAVAEGAIIGRGRDGVLQGVCGIESRVCHAERTEDFALAEHVEG